MLRKALEKTHVLFGERGSADPDRIGVSSLMECDRIHLTFNDDDESLFSDVAFGVVESVEDFTLVEDA